jgi:hypothetical protein
VQLSSLSELPDSDAPLPTHKLSLAQRARRDAGLTEHRQRQLLYPYDPADPQGRKRIPRRSPQRQARLLAVPRETATPCHHICVEHPSKHPNEFLYLYLLNPDDNGGARTFAWFRHAPDPATDPTAKGHAMLARTYSSVYEAITHVARTGWLDAAW